MKLRKSNNLAARTPPSIDKPNSLGAMLKQAKLKIETAEGAKRT